MVGGEDGGCAWVTVLFLKLQLTLESPGGLVKHMLSPEFLIQPLWGEDQESAFLTSYEGKTITK